MSHRLLRSYANLLVVLGWLHVVLFTLLGFAPWLGFVGQLVPAVSQWESWALYASPAVGLLIGTLCGLAYFVVSGVIRVLLDQRDFLEEILQAHRHLLRHAESQQPSGDSGAKDPFDLTEIRGTGELLL
ncbi:MAG: hypothetical protein H6Q86_3164 [candidate division NC10 bacterium]|jgi:hypothetical protein|nr:hypothetical protein [candidate division NC10 bacterium]MBP2672272.1 hypothetical protein [candidate division NC10 bacterium]